nr:MAG TPA: hypothetical protein [Caudoviricetes sp.]
MLKLYRVHSRFFCLWKTNFKNNTFVPQGKEKMGPKISHFFNLYILKYL